MEPIYLGLGVLFCLLCIKAVITYKKAIRASNFILEVYTSILTFEWKPSEEIGKLIARSDHPAIREFIDDYYRKYATDDTERERFTKQLAVGIISGMTGIGYAESERVTLTKEWCDAHPHIIAELTPEEIAWHLERPKFKKYELPDEEAQQELDRVVSEVEKLFDELHQAGLFDLVLCKKKPGGKRPPRLSRRASRTIVDNIPVGAPA